MSGPPPRRRTDKAVSGQRAREMLRASLSGRLGTVGVDGWPCVVPLLYVCMEGQIYAHDAQARGHLRQNVEHDPRVCFEVDEPGPAFAYGRSNPDRKFLLAREARISGSWRGVPPRGAASAPEISDQG